MDRMRQWVLLGLVVGLCSISLEVMAVKGDQFSTAPVLQKGKKWRVAFWQSGPWLTYPPRAYGFVEELMALGWVDKASLPPPKDANDAKTLWDWLAKDAKSPYLEFPADLFFDANWDKGLRSEQKLGILERGKKGELDVVIVAGTETAKELANNEHAIPTLVMSVSDAVKAGIVSSADDSGRDHLNAGVSPKRYTRQLQLFHQVFKFKRLGMIYEGTAAGKTYAAFADAEALAKEHGFKLVTCNAVDTELNTELKAAEDAYLKCVREISPRIDAMYVSAHRAVGTKIVEIATIFNQAKIPTFSQLGSDQVKYGLLMSIAQSSRRYEGRTVARKMAQIFHGAKPRELNQVVDEPNRIAINMKAAALIGYEPATDVLDLVDEVYKKIEIPPPPKK